MTTFAVSLAMRDLFIAWARVLNGERNLPGTNANLGRDLRHRMRRSPGPRRFSERAG